MLQLEERNSQWQHLMDFLSKCKWCIICVCCIEFSRYQLNFNYRPRNYQQHAYSLVLRSYRSVVDCRRFCSQGVETSDDMLSTKSRYRISDSEANTQHFSEVSSFKNKNPLMGSWEEKFCHVQGQSPKGRGGSVTLEILLTMVFLK